MTDSTPDLRGIMPLFEGSRLRLARDLRGWTAAHLADEVGVTGASIGQFEKDRSRPAAATLHRLSLALRVPPSFFAIPVRPPLEPVEALFRNLRSITSHGRRQALAQVHLLREIALELEKYVALPKLNLPCAQVDVGQCSRSSYIEQMAMQLRSHWRVPRGPVENATRLLEKNGVLVARLHVDAGKVGAFCVDSIEKPVIALEADRNSRDQSRMDAAQELGRLVLRGGGGPAGGKLVLKEAREFARAFLMPAEDIASGLPNRLDWPTLLRLEVRWQVPLSALLARARDLEIMNESAFTRGRKTLSTIGWPEIKFDVLGKPEAPTLLRRALEMVEADGVSFPEFVGRAALPEHDVLALIGQTTDERLPVKI